jgi:hypothetical protein
MAARSIARISVTTAALVVCGALAGCVTLDPFTKRHEGPPAGPISEVAVTWDKAIAFVPDFTHGGAMTPGLMCRVYLFGADAGVPLAGDGTVAIDLFDDTSLASGGKAVLKEQWNLDKDTLKGCLRKDLVGWGYTLFLPWGTYNPSIKQVHMMVRYTPGTGIPFYQPSQTMSLIHPDGGPAGLAQHGNPAETRATQTAKAANEPATVDREPRTVAR